ncbi:MAG: ImmA/IrrE family metallo-endopeptidase [Pseudomonadota bacterium]
MTAETLTPPKAANRLNRILETVSSAHELNRFPVNIEELALGVNGVFGWQDKIAEIQAADIPGFEGCLVSNDTKTTWFILYNDSMKSPGRVRFTQAHELGHYILHRFQKDSFECPTAGDMCNLSTEEKDIESEADEFASYLLMPFDDFRKQLNDSVDLDLLGHCAIRYGVSLTAAILRWLEITEVKAVLIISRSGFMKWAWSSKTAFKAGAFFRTKQNTIPIPLNSLAANELIKQERKGVNIPGRTWFRHAEATMDLKEMKIISDNFDYVITLLILPSVSDVWPDRTF